MCLTPERALFSIVCVRIVTQNWILEALNSSGNFKASPSYCHTNLKKEAKFERQKFAF